MMHEAARALARRIQGIELATLGHFLEEGFLEPAIRAINEVRPVSGPATTVDLLEPDALTVNRAILAAQPGSVLVVRVRGGLHAPVGAVTAAAAIAAGIVAIVVDGPVTDASELHANAEALPVFARGLTPRTTKRQGSELNTINEPIHIGGVRVRSGDLVVCDENGVLVLRPELDLQETCAAARESDSQEPSILHRIRSGEPLRRILAH